ncbi:MAG: acetyl-CoA carboxylase carboxyltransferase subunit alpha [Planctomycetota bacterium]
MAIVAPQAASPPGANVGLMEFEKPLGKIQLEIDGLFARQKETGLDLANELRLYRNRFKTTVRRIYSNLTPWETVLVARHPKRPLVPDYIQMAFRDFCELHGDRTFGDDCAIITGFARIGGHRVMVVGHNKGKDLKERMRCNFGCAHPEGYRKALLKMRLAEKYGVPVVCLIDTQGAYPGIGAEERGISQAIAVNLMEMSRLRVPVVCVIVSEGGSGGALGIGVGDCVAMFQHAFYSVISPEGCAAILWKTAERRKHAAEALRITATELVKLGLVDDVINEPAGGAHREPETAAAALEKYLVEKLDDLTRTTIDALLRRRQNRIRELGRFFESPAELAKSKEKSVAPVPLRRPGARVSRLTHRIPAAVPAHS